MATSTHHGPSANWLVVSRSSTHTNEDKGACLVDLRCIKRMPSLPLPGPIRWRSITAANSGYFGLRGCGRS